MGNVRNPVGPLPSAIYWRRRAVVLFVFALLLALVVWAVTSGGGSQHSGDNGAQGPAASRTPVASITPGPTSGQTGITGRPGGRGGSGGDGGAGASGGSGGTDGSGGDGAGDGGAGASGGSGGGQLPAGTPVPDCVPATTQLKVHSVKSSYAPGEDPAFELTATNGGGSACKVNFGSTAAILTITSGDAHVWASDDCPANRAAILMEVAAGGSTTYRVQWNRNLTAPQCASPPGVTSAQPGTYVVKVSGDGLGSSQISFVLTSA